jgi:putative intracellular protease/amidase
MQIGRLFHISTIAFLMLVSGCVAAEPTQVLPTITQVQPTVTPVPATVTPTPHPTDTPTLTPSATPTDIPTNTPTITNTPGPRVKHHLGVSVLLLLPDQYGANFYLNKDNFERMGWRVTTAGVNKIIQPCAGFAKPHGCRNVEVDLLISEIDDISQYDVLAVMPATQFSFTSEPYADLLGNKKALDLIASANAEGLVVFAPCAGTKVLAAAGVLYGKNITGKPVYKKDYEGAGANFLGAPLPPVIDQNIVTVVRGLYYHVQNIEAVATSLESSWIEFSHDQNPPVESTQIQSPIQDGTVWTQTLGGPQADGGSSIVQTKDGGFIIAGYTYSFGAGNSDGYLVKSDPLGNLTWAKTFGGQGWEYLFSVQQTRDGGYIIVGYTTSTGAGLKDVLLIKTDTRGEQTWAKTFGGAGVDVGKSVMQTKDGGYILVGYTESFGVGESDIYLIKVDPNGDEIWSKTFGDAGPDRGHSLDLALDGGYIITGASGSYSDNSDVYLLKTDHEGNEQWFRTVSLPDTHLNYDWGNMVQTTVDGGYIIVGNSDLEEDVMDVLLIKTDSDGEAVWVQVFGDKFYDYGSSVSETRDGGFIVSGATKNASTGQNDVYLWKVDQDGNEVWTQTYGTIEGSEWGSAVIESHVGDFIILGHSDSFGAGHYDIWLMQVDEDGNMGE